MKEKFKELIERIKTFDVKTKVGVAIAIIITIIVISVAAVAMTSNNKSSASITTSESETTKVKKVEVSTTKAVETSNVETTTVENTSTVILASETTVAEATTVVQTKAAVKATTQATTAPTAANIGAIADLPANQEIVVAPTAEAQTTVPVQQTYTYAGKVVSQKEYEIRTNPTYMDITSSCLLRPIEIPGYSKGYAFIWFNSKYGTTDGNSCETMYDIGFNSDDYNSKLYYEADGKKIYETYFRAYIVYPDGTYSIFVKPGSQQPDCLQYQLPVGESIFH